MTDERLPFPLDEQLSLVERVAALEQDLAGVRDVLGIGSVRDGEGGNEQPDAEGPVDHGAPPPDLCQPAAWRGLPDPEIVTRWEDLRAWVDWLITAYRLPPRPWEAWWLCPGVCEELAALRAWHRELVDVPVASVRHPPEGSDLYDEIEWQRGERTVRLDLARSHVEWHEALWRLVARVAGVQAEQKPLLLRESEATERTPRLRSEEHARRAADFARWRASIATTPATIAGGPSTSKGSPPT